MNAKWDGSERRKENPEFNVLNAKTDRVYAFLEREFGGMDLAGNFTEGSTKRDLRELKEKVTLQNGRVAKLEKRNVFLDGSAFIIGALVTFAGVLVFWIKK